MKAAMAGRHISLSATGAAYFFASFLLKICIFNHDGIYSPEEAMIYPLVAMLVLVLIMFGAAFSVRMYAVKTGDVKLSHYRVFEGPQPPVYVTRICHNLSNLFQVPPIFYSAAVLAIALGIESELALVGAWGFVGARYAHTLVHVTVNHYLLRAGVFTVSLVFLVMLWVAVLAAV